jgi:hypothetical protein
MERFPNATTSELRQLLVKDAQKDFLRFKPQSNDVVADIQNIFTRAGHTNATELTSESPNLLLNVQGLISILMPTTQPRKK